MKDQTKDKENLQAVHCTTNNLDKAQDKGLWRDLVAFWFLGICNNYGFIVMLAGLFSLPFKLIHR